MIRYNVRTTHACSRHPLYIIWEQMRSRCLNKRHRDYPLYGGRGIRIATEFSNAGYFISYLETTLGPRPVNTTLDRIDNNKGYEPGNLRWATATEQAYNRRNTVRYIHEGRLLTIKEIANEAGVNYEILSNRIRKKRHRGQGINITAMIDEAKNENPSHRTA